MNINYHKTVDISSESGEIVEPVTLQEMKDYMRLEGFVDADESTSTDLESFDFDDDLLTEMITMAREQFEKFCGISLIPKKLKSFINNGCSMIEIPWGPTSSITSLKDTNDNDLTYKLSGFLGGFVNLKSPCYCEMIMIHEAGYGNTDCPEVPKSIKLDLMKLIAYHYENRKNSTEGSRTTTNDGRFISSLASKYSRNIWIA